MNKNATQTNHKSLKMTGDCAKQAIKLKETSTQLTDTDLKFDAGKEAEMLKHIGDKLSKKRDRVISVSEKELPLKI